MTKISERKKDKEFVNPFPGLRPYYVGEKNYFYVPGERLEDMERRLIRNQVLMIIGDEATGKSSLVNAALIPELIGGLSGKGGVKWEHIHTRPGTNPIRNLAFALAHSSIFAQRYQIGPDIEREIEEMLRKNSNGLLDVFNSYEIAPGCNSLIYIDEFEDLFTLNDLENDSAYVLSYINLLLRFFKLNQKPVYFVITMSAEYLAAASQYSGFPEMINKTQYVIPKLDPYHIKKLIYRGLEYAGLKMTSDLISSIWTDYKTDNDLLTRKPGVYQLQYALKRTVNAWIHDGDRTSEIEKKYYTDEKFGVTGIDNAIANHADRIYDAFTKEQQIICKKLFQSIAHIALDNIVHKSALTVERLSEIIKVSVSEVIEVINSFSKEELFLFEIIQNNDIERRLSKLNKISNDSQPELSPKSIVSFTNSALCFCWPKLEKWTRVEGKNVELFSRLSQDEKDFTGEKGQYYRDQKLKDALNWYYNEKPNKEWAKRYADNFDKSIAFLFKSDKDEKAEKDKEQQYINNKIKSNKKLTLYLWIIVIGGILAGAILSYFYYDTLQAKKKFDINQKRIFIDRFFEVQTVKQSLQLISLDSILINSKGYDSLLHNERDLIRTWVSEKIDTIEIYRDENRKKGDSLINSKYPWYNVENFEKDLFTYCETLENYYQKLSIEDLQISTFQSYVVIDDIKKIDYCWYVLGHDNWIDIKCKLDDWIKNEAYKKENCPDMNTYIEVAKKRLQKIQDKKKSVF